MNISGSGGSRRIGSAGADVLHRLGEAVLRHATNQVKLLPQGTYL